MDKTKDMKKSIYPWFFSVIILAMLLIIVLILAFKGYFFSLSYLSSNTDLTLGENVTINLEPNRASVLSFTFDGSLLPKEKLAQTIQIKASDLNKNLKVRVKAEVFGEENAVFDFVTTDDFVKSADGYFYLNEELNAGTKITFSTFLIMPNEAVFESNKKYILSIIVENLDASLDVENIWQFEEIV